VPYAASKPKHRYTGSIIAACILLILVVAANQFKHLLMPVSDIHIAVDKQCDLRTAACHSVLVDGGEVRFEITPKTLPVLQPLRLTVSTQDIEATAVTVNFVGVNMDMGINKTVLSKNSSDTFTGITQIPACMHAKMDWVANVILHTPRGKINVPFHFYTLNQ
jgi:hypothetical protein